MAGWDGKWENRITKRLKKIKARAKEKYTAKDNKTARFKRKASIRIEMMLYEGIEQLLPCDMVVIRLTKLADKIGYKNLHFDESFNSSLSRF